MSGLTLRERLSFLLGDLRSQPGVPWFSSKVRHHQVSPAEAYEGIKTAEFGDIGLHRDSGFLSNLVFPGVFKHAWIHVEDPERDGFENARIVEAVSEGVLLNNAVVPLLTDYAVILRPKSVSSEDRKGACLKAKSLVGFKYDADFKFDIEREMEFLDKRGNRPAASADLVAYEESLHSYKPSFSCSEVVAYSWWHKREPLRIYRRHVLGKYAILPSDFMNGSFKVVWCSKSVSTDGMKKLGLPDEGLQMLSDFGV